MTEAEWLVCTDPVSMLNHLLSKMSRRKIRLFACALARRLWPILVNKQSRKAILMAEHHADGLVTDAKFFTARRAAETVHRKICSVSQIAEDELNKHGIVDNAVSLATAVAAWVTRENPFRMRCSDGNYLLLLLVLQARLAEDFERKVFDEYSSQANLLREVMGNPFRSFAVDPSWMKWRDGLIERLSQETYEQRRFEDLPILADALEEAGCNNADILNHCRGGGEHVLGCWVLDALLGKE